MKVVRYMGFATVTSTVVAIILYWVLQLPSPEQEAARFNHVTKISLRENGKNIGGKIVYDEAVLDAPEEIKRFMATVTFDLPSNNCRCLYSSYITFTTDKEDIDVILGPHDFWVEHWGDRINAFGTPPNLLATFDRYFETKP